MDAAKPAYCKIVFAMLRFTAMTWLRSRAAAAPVS
jgi:hypothetical protein